jgi:glycosyltransferase involved in cell wall biosynthesis
VIASDVGSFREDVVEGKTGFVFKPEHTEGLAQTIQKYFESDLYCELRVRRPDICEFASERYSWNRVATITRKVYGDLLCLARDPVKVT